MRSALKAADPDAFLLGEVWEDATTKESYNRGRRYALGAGLDSVMNYPFMFNTLDFLLGHTDAFTYRRFLVSQSQNYPKEMYYSLMNLISSHDIARIRTTLATGVSGKGMSREQQAGFIVDGDADARGAALMRCAAALQYSLPGMPVIYYGDEIGTHGLLDPFNRGTFYAWGDDDPENGDGALQGAACFTEGETMERPSPYPVRARDPKLVELYAALGRLRRERGALRTGGALYYSTNGDVIGVLRYCFGGEDEFGAPAEDEALLTVVNPGNDAHRIVIDLCAEKEGLSYGKWKLMSGREWNRAVRLLRCADDADDSARGDAAAEVPRELPITDALIDISIPPRTAEIFDLRFA
jgi:glycosidase